MDSDTRSIPVHVKTVADTFPLMSCLHDINQIIPRSDLPSLFFDIEGVNLGRNGSISILSIYAPSRNTVYLIDVHVMGEKSFSMSRSGITLKSVLESPSILKGVFDARNDSDALFNLYGIKLDGIRDVQLMEIGTRKGSKAYLCNLSKCIDNDGPFSRYERELWQVSKAVIGWSLESQPGNQFERINERPLFPEVAEYCAQDMTFLSDLYKSYDMILKLPANKLWQNEVLIATKERIKLSQSPAYVEDSQEKDRGPWTTEYLRMAINDWNARTLNPKLRHDLRTFEL